MSDEILKPVADKEVEDPTLRASAAPVAQPDEPEIDFSIGSLVEGKFKVLSILGHGGMGTVYKVEQVLLRQQFALKTIKGDELSDTVWRRFQKEAQAISKLDHANIVKAREFGLIKGDRPYLLMDLAEGETLSKRIKRTGQLELKDAIDIFIPVCFALSYAHDEGIVHRDLKPSNIILCEKQNGSKEIEPKIVDFGIAKVVSDESHSPTLTQTGEIFGTPYYMSPEQCRGEQIDSRCDIYSLGCVMFEAFTGAPPFPGNSPVAIIGQHLGGQAPSLKEASMGVSFPGALEKLIASMLAKSPAERIQRMDEIARELIAIKESLEGKKSSTIAGLGAAPLERRRIPAREILYACVGLALGVLAGSFFTVHGNLQTAGVQQNTLPAGPDKPEKVTSESMEPSYYSSINGKERIFYLPKGADGIRLAKEIPQGHTGMISAGDDKTLQCDRAHAFIDPIWAALNPKYILRFRADDLRKITLASRSKPGHGYMQLGDACLSYLSNMTSVTELELQESCFDDNGLRFLANMPLTGLTVRADSITGSGIASLGGVSTLKELTLENVGGLDPLLDKLVQTNKVLGILRIKKTTLSQEQIQKISKLTSLCSLQLEQIPNLDAKKLLPVQSLTKLDSLYLDDCLLLDDKLSEVLNRMPWIGSLSLQRIKITDRCVASITKLSKLRDLRVNGTALTNDAMRQIAALNNLKDLEIQNTQITPASMPYLRELRKKGLAKLEVSSDNLEKVGPWKDHLAELEKMGFNLQDLQMGRNVRLFLEDGDAYASTTKSIGAE